MAGNPYSLPTCSDGELAKGRADDASTRYHNTLFSPPSILGEAYASNIDALARDCGAACKIDPHIGVIGV